MTAINFKQIRQMQGLTLKEAASGICSIQMLSRWENGTGNMDFEKTLKLLERVNITSVASCRYFGSGVQFWYNLCSISIN